jgi:hypothetical protein
MLAGHHKSSGLPPAADGTDAADALRGFLEEGEGPEIDCTGILGRMRLTSEPAKPGLGGPGSPAWPLPRLSASERPRKKQSGRTATIERAPAAPHCGPAIYDPRLACSPLVLDAPPSAETVAIGGISLHNPAIS